MILVVVAVQVSERTMIRAMFGAAVEALFVRTPVRFAELIVEFAMASVTVAPVVVVVR
jgi:hypothetical protein